MLDCEICGKADPGVTCLLPIMQGDRLDTIACEPCARRSGAYCVIHDKPHVGFGSESSMLSQYLENLRSEGERSNARPSGFKFTACMHCIEEMIRDALPRHEEISARVFSVLDEQQCRDVEGAIRDQVDAGFAPQLALVRMLATYAVRYRMTIDEALAHMEGVAKGNRLPNKQGGYDGCT